MEKINKMVKITRVNQKMIPLYYTIINIKWLVVGNERELRIVDTKHA
jgi:hypothetical protein